MNPIAVILMALVFGLSVGIFFITVSVSVMIGITIVEKIVDILDNWGA